MLTVLDLFSGIGGFSLGLESTGKFRTVAFCEIEDFPRKVLKKHWPTLPIHGDIYELSGSAYAGINVVVGGFPCQPVSLAGKRRGKEDSRWLWPEFFRIIREAKPRWCIIENVPGLRTKHADEVLADLEEQGYAYWPIVVGAVHAGAPHRRQRVWIVAYPQGERRQGEGQWREPQEPWAGPVGEEGDAADANRQWDWQRAPEPVLRGMDDGLPCWMDRRQRLKALGNSVVPQIVAEIGKAILTVEDRKCRG